MKNDLITTRAPSRWPADKERAQLLDAEEEILKKRSKYYGRVPSELDDGPS